MYHYNSKLSEISYIFDLCKILYCNKWDFELYRALLTKYREKTKNMYAGIKMNSFFLVQIQTAIIIYIYIYIYTCTRWHPVLTSKHGLQLIAKCIGLKIEDWRFSEKLLQSRSGLKIEDSQKNFFNPGLDWRLKILRKTSSIQVWLHIFNVGSRRLGKLMILSAKKEKGKTFEKIGIHLIR